MTAFKGTNVICRDNALMLIRTIKYLSAAIVLLHSFAMTASADIWRWSDAEGETHYVDTMTPIYTWFDEAGKAWYSDTPDHVSAVAVVLVWHSTANSIEEAEAKSERNSRNDAAAHPGETAEERFERESAEAYYCKQAREIYDSYRNAPKLYRTGEAGDREYLSAEDAEQMLAETEARVNELCSKSGAR